MKKQNLGIFVLFAVFILLIFLVFRGDFMFAVTGQETMTRTLLSKVKAGSTFTLKYVAHGTSGKWGATIEDSVSGGCLFPNGKSTFKTVMISDEGNTKTITITAPSTATTCIFSGDYQFGDKAIKNFPNQQVIVGIQKTGADINWDGKVDRGELGAYIIKWIDGKISRAELAQAIMAWVEG